MIDEFDLILLDQESNSNDVDAVTWGHETGHDVIHSFVDALLLKAVHVWIHVVDVAEIPEGARHDERI